MQIIRKNIGWLYNDEFKTCQNVCSYSTSINISKTVVDNYFGDFIVADLNFDGKDDFAFIYDSGGTGGPVYYFYLQKADGKFERNLFLCEKMGYFPHEINAEKKYLKTLSHATADSVSERIYAMNPASQRWYLKSERLLNH